MPGIGINVQSTDKENEIEISEAVHDTWNQEEIVSLKESNWISGTTLHFSE